MGGPGTYLGTGEGALFRMISTDLKELYEVVLEEGTFASLQIFGFLFFFFETKVSGSQAGSDLCIEVSLAFVLPVSPLKCWDHSCASPGPASFTNITASPRQEREILLFSLLSFARERRDISEMKRATASLFSAFARLRA